MRFCMPARFLCWHVLPMPGMVYDVRLRNGSIYALCLNEAMTSTLVTVPPCRIRQMLRLEGMPGALAMCRETLLCATEGFLHAVSMDGTRVLRTEKAAGRARQNTACGRQAAAVRLADGEHGDARPRRAMAEALPECKGHVCIFYPR